ncbi:hypothetical protein GCM10011378_07180 [Hymenobacter glacieicola]|uniref:Glycosyl transferase family 1 domain-containing protein n=1 Tax=Hymenobacter glacieicola TaxID=1562124 RepID=A0ABQ1WJX8_9BACT|nr:hypothetical protein GCM10011378_07180 [Hymenobacter glacieicola]
MQYEFRDVVHKGKTVRYIKSVGFNSDGYSLASEEMLRLGREIQLASPDIVIVLMVGNGSTLAEDTKFLAEVTKLFPRKYDEFYKWQVATL